MHSNLAPTLPDALPKPSEEKHTSIVFQNGHIYIDKHDRAELNEIQKKLKCTLSDTRFQEPVVTACCGSIFNLKDLVE